MGLDEQAEVEDELVALVFGMSDDDGEAKDGVFAVGRVDGEVAVAKGLARDDVFLEDVEINEGWTGVGCVGGGDASWGRLGDDFGA